MNKILVLLVKVEYLTMVGPLECLSSNTLYLSLSAREAEKSETICFGFFLTIPPGDILLMVELAES